ncbi:MAG: carbamoyltransferase N-terminal domain-containing protein, partial [Anaerolineales bacterium]|nr:carbamoyltransferase N-terminal domain-containing protein [Anaerolineales bacterium]
MVDVSETTILGISDSSVCGGAALLRGGRIVAAVNEERLNRQKMSTGFPERSIRRVLEMENLSPEDIDHVYAADEYNYFKPESTRWQGWLVDETGSGKGILYKLASEVSGLIGSSSLAQDAYYAIRRRLTAGRRKKLPRLLQETFDFRCPVSFVDHHYSHALAAYYTGGHPDATVITLDGGGDGLCSRVYRVRNGSFELLNTVRSYHSIGNFYAYVTHICGYTAHKHEGKITGLAARGEPVYLELLDDLITYEDGQFRNRGRCYFESAVRKIRKRLPADFRKQDLAASIQKLLEKHAVRYCDYWVQQSGIGHVVLCGGVFANVRLNQFIHELPSVDTIFVHPGMGDDGLAFGAALTPRAGGGDSGDAVSAGSPLSDVYFGPGYTDADIEEVLRRQGLEFVYEP